MKSITGATTGRIALPAAMNGACPIMRPPPMTAVETPSPMTISVLGLAVARKTLPAARDEAARAAGGEERLQPNAFDHAAGLETATVVP